MFDKIDANKLFKHKSYDYAIETKNKIFLSILFRICLLRNFKFFESINLKNKFIVFFLSFANTFIMFVKKKNENLRLLINYRKLNFIAVKNRYFISLIEQLLNRLIETAIFTKLNIRFAYNTLRIRIDNE